MKASLTVEMTLLFPILLMMVLLMMGLSIYVYDRCVIKQCVYDALLQGSREEYDTRQQKKQAMQEKLEESLADYAICLEGTQIVYEARKQIFCGFARWSFPSLWRRNYVAFIP